MYQALRTDSCGVLSVAPGTIPSDCKYTKQTNNRNTHLNKTSTTRSTVATAMMSSDDDDGDATRGGSEREAAFVNQERNASLMTTSVSAAGSAPETLSPLTEIFDDHDHFEKYFDDNRKARWRCLWCNEDFAGHNATKCLRHVVKVTGMGIKICTASIPGMHYKRYYNLYERKLGAKSQKKGKYLFI